ncbi:MAG: efflux RND transporter permease subunit [Bacteroidetes bacterium]|nr:efflux RND transporter permease subunit [Bacteroidota bacterium]
MKHYFHGYKHPISIVLALIIAFGVFSYSKMQISLFPEITFPKIKVIADDGEQPVDKMMISVTQPLENAIKQIPDISLIRSATSRGTCEISAFLNWNSDINFNLQMLESRINQIKGDLPSSVHFEIEKMNPSILPVMGYTLESTTKSPVELNLIARYIVKPYLSQIQGIADVRVIGGKVKEFWIEPSPQKMSAAGITIDQLSTVLGQTNFINSNGLISDYRRLYLTITDAGLYNKADIENVVIKNTGKRILKLKDIAKVEIQEKVEYIKINANGKQALLVAIIKQPEANLTKLSENIISKKAELEKILPKGVKLKPYYNQSDFVEESISSVNDSLWLGLFLAIFVAVLFLRSLKASATILITIPITLMLTVVVLYSFGFTMNIMTLGAIAAAIGLIIDDAVVVVEQIHRTHEEFPNRTSKQLVHQAIHYLLPSMVGSSISTIVIFIPFMLMGGVAGAYFTVLTNTMIITLVCSFIVTWLGLPVVYLLLTDIQNKKKTVKPIKAKIAHPQKWVSFFIHRPFLSIFFVLLLLGSIYFILPRLETGFLPEMDEGSIVLDYTAPPGTSPDAVDKILQEVEKIVIGIPEEESYSRRTGAQMGLFITEPNRGDYLIQLKKDRSRTTEEVIDDIRKKVEATQPALRIEFGQVIGDMLGDLMASAEPIEIKIFGDNQDKLKELSKLVAAEVSKVQGTADVFDGITIAGPSVEVKPDAQKLAQYNITPTSFQFQLQTQLEGVVVGSIFEKEQRTDIRMIYPEGHTSGVEKMKQQSFFTPDGTLKPLSSFANVELKEGVAEINREDLQSMGLVTARLNERDLGSVMKDIQHNIKSNISLPQGYHISYGGAYAEQKKSFDELLMILILASLLVFALMLFLFRDFRVALIILFIAVLGTAGSLILLFLTKTPLNVGSYTGLIMIVGIIGENAIFTFQQFVTNRKTGTVDESLIYAISTRLRPKLMTALGAIIALLPLATGIGAGAQMHQPLAIAVIGGFIIALPLLLIVFPSLLRLFYKDSEVVNEIEEEETK